MTIKKTTKKKLESSCQTCGTNYKAELATYKANCHKLWSQIFNKPNVDVWI